MLFNVGQADIIMPVKFKSDGWVQKDYLIYDMYVTRRDMTLPLVFMW